MLVEGTPKRLENCNRVMDETSAKPAALFWPSVTAALAPAWRNGLKGYWLIDQSALPPPPWLGRQVGSMAWGGLLGVGKPDSFDGATPLVLECADTARSRRFAEELFRVGRWANAVSVLVSDLQLAPLCDALALRAPVQLPGGLQAILRFFDTRTLPALPQILTSDQYEHSLANIESWFYLDRWGALQRMPQAAARIPQAPPRWPLVLNQEQEQSLVDDGLTDAVIDLLITQRHPVTLSNPPPRQFDLVQPLVDDARRFFIEDPPDALIFVAKALEHGAGFHGSEPWASALQRYAAKSCTLEEAFAP